MRARTPRGVCELLGCLARMRKKGGVVRWIQGAARTMSLEHGFMGVSNLPLFEFSGTSIADMARCEAA